MSSNEDIKEYSNNNPVGKCVEYNNNNPIGECRICNKSIKQYNNDGNYCVYCELCRYLLIEQIEKEENVEYKKKLSYITDNGW